MIGFARSLLRLVAPPQCPTCGRRIAREPGLCVRCSRRLDREGAGPFLVTLQGRRPPAARTLELPAGPPSGGDRPPPGETAGVSPARLPPERTGPDAGFWLRPAGPPEAGEPGSLTVIALGLYQGCWGRLVRAYKGDPDSAPARLLVPSLARLMAGAAEAGGGKPPAGPVLVPVPMARVRRREKGVNPAERLARAVSRETGWPLAVRALIRHRFRRPLRGLSPADRAAEIRGAVAPGPEARAIRGRDAILLDDVMTTGATLRECARALAAGGAARTAAGVLGWTPRRRFRSSRRGAGVRS